MLIQNSRVFDSDLALSPMIMADSFFASQKARVKKLTPTPRSRWPYHTREGKENYNSVLMSDLLFQKSKDLIDSFLIFASA